jgi:hypothetical protein
MKYYLSPTNEVFAYEADGSQDHLIPNDYTPTTEAEVNARIAAKEQAHQDSLTYAQKRADEYPSFADQFDLLYHGGYDAWKAAIDVVKNKYPKG